MDKWRLIISKPDSVYNNMAVDEALFASAVKNNSFPVLRLYRWDSPCITIGYFQKYSDFSVSNIPVVRRITGGLKVEHGQDISYSLVTSRKFWPSMDNQERSYFLMHEIFLKTINDLGYNASFCENASGRSGNVCTQTFFNYDLLLNGSKILGSCLRKRGNTLLQQGSLHINGIASNFATFATLFSKNLQNILSVEITETNIHPEILNLSDNLAANKYSSDEWNRKY